MHQGQSKAGGNITYQLAETGGVETVTLTVQQIPMHNHALLASTNVAQQTQPTNQVLANSATALMYFEDNPTAALNAKAMTAVGGSQPHDDFQPYLCIDFIISLFGIFPTPS
jgi:microcystin-dependent protein